MKKLSIMMVAAILLISALTCTACASDTNYNNIAADIAADRSRSNPRPASSQPRF